MPTPSPHRFLAFKSGSDQKPARRQSSLRHGVTADGPVANTPKTTTAKRFVIAPTQSTPHSVTCDESANEARPQRRAPASPRPRLPLQKVESIDEGSDSPPASLKQEESSGHLIDFAGDSMSNAGDDEADAEILFTQKPNKRRRISLESPSSPTQAASCDIRLPQTPQVAAPALGASSHRFLVTPSRTSALPSSCILSLSQGTPVPNRPHFVLPTQTRSPVNPAAPGPETFSPSRKGQKFIPGGLASTLQSWVVETASTGYQSQIRETVVWGREKEDGVKLRVQLAGLRTGKEVTGEGDENVECYPGGVVFATGAVDPVSRRNAHGLLSEEESTAKLILAGLGNIRGVSHVTLRKKDMVGLRAPLWNVTLENGKWIVAVDWVIL